MLQRKVALLWTKSSQLIHACMLLFSPQGCSAGIKTLLWRNAQEANPITESPEAHCWRTIDENLLQVVWFEGPPSPSKLSSVVANDKCIMDEEIEDDDDDDNGSYSISSDEEDDEDEQ